MRSLRKKAPYVNLYAWHVDASLDLTYWLNTVSMCVCLVDNLGVSQGSGGMCHTPIKWVCVSCVQLIDCFLPFPSLNFSSSHCHSHQLLLFRFLFPVSRPFMLQPCPDVINMVLLLSLCAEVHSFCTACCVVILAS